MPKILIVEDDTDIANLEKDYLEMAGFEVVITADSENALKLARTGNFSLILLDVMLPGTNGYRLCQSIREFSDLPIIIVTARREPVDIIRGLGLGSDDYVTKPFDPAVLVARVKACIKSYNRHKHLNREIKIGDLTIIPPSFQVFKKDTEITLPRKEFDLLYFLARHPNIVFSKDDLFEHIWGLDSLADTATVTVHINRIREKIEDDPSHPTYLKTIWGTGYCLKDDTKTKKPIPTRV